VSDLETIASVSLGRLVVDDTCRHLRRMGRGGFEGFVLWVGIADGTHFTVTQAVVPQQRAVRSSCGTYVEVGSEELHRLNVWLYSNKLELLAQVHSHPADAYHSTTDDAYAIATTVGCFSFVVPYFAVRPFALVDCAVYQLRRSGEWAELTSRQVTRMFSIGE